MTVYVGNEDAIADAWIYATLTADTGAGGVSTLVGGRIHNEDVPEGSAYPVVRYQQLATTAENGLGAQYIASDLLYLIEVIGQTGDYDELAPAARRIYTLFHDKEAAISGGYVLASVRERMTRRAETPSGIPYRRLGHVFRVAVQPT